MTTQSRVDAIFDRPTEQGISLAMVVMHRGEVVAERYGLEPQNEFGPAIEITAESSLISWSVAKSIVHAAVGLLVGDGVLDLDAPADVPQWRGTDKQAITLLDLLEMRSGLEFVEDYVDGDASHCIAMLFSEGAHDHAAYAADLPLIHPPGSAWNYSSGSTNIVASILARAVGGGQQGMQAFLAERLFGPCGMTSAVPHFDEVGNWVGSSYVYANTRDFAKFGELYRRDGLSEAGARILPAGWVDHGRTFVAHEPADDLEFGLDYGRHWWMWPELPGSLAAHGYEGQYIVVVPDRELTVVHLGKTGSEVRCHLLSHLRGLILAVPIST